MLIEVNSYKRSQKIPSGTGSQYNISGVEFSGVRVSYEVYLCCHHPKEFKKLSKHQKNELVYWMHSNHGKKLLKDYRKATQTKNRKVSSSGKEGDKKPEGGGNWKKKLKQTMNKPNGLKPVIPVLAEEQKTNKALISDFQSSKRVSVCA